MCGGAGHLHLLYKAFKKGSQISAAMRKQQTPLLSLTKPGIWGGTDEKCHNKETEVEHTLSLTQSGHFGGREEKCHREETDTEQTGSRTALYNYKAYEEDEQRKAMVKKKKPTLRTHVHSSYKASVNRQMPWWRSASWTHTFTQWTRHLWRASRQTRQ